MLRAGNTTLGLDSIPIAVLQAAWPLIEPLVIDLYQKCLRVSHYLAPFRSAMLAIILKPKKLDQTSPQAYYLIALLSVLGKGLKCLLAQNISQLVVQLQILINQQFSALPLQLFIDLTSYLIYNIESTLNSKLQASLLILDIKGTFNRVLLDCLIYYLQE